MHQIKKSYEDLAEGDIVLFGEADLGLYRWWYWAYIVKAKLPGERLRVSKLPPGDIVPKNETRPYVHYRCSLVYSPDNEGRDDDWSECEKHYGIGPYGSVDPDPVRLFALAVLKGDPVAADAVRDILKIYGGPTHEKKD